jgi:hypothetical protein
MTAIEYLQQSLDDADVRKNLARGAEATRQAARQVAGRRPTKAAKKTTLQRKLRDAVSSLGRAGAAAREAERKRERSQRRRRILLFGLVGTTVAIGLSGPTRSKAREVLGGHDQVSDPQPASPPQAPVEAT